MTGYALMSVLTTILLVGLSRPGENPVRIFGRAVVALFRTNGGRVFSAAAILVLALDLVETSLDAGVTRDLGYDLTPFVHSIEGDLVARLQRFSTPLLNGFFSWIYAPGFVALVSLPPVVWFGIRKNRATAEYVTAFCANYVFALPFYVFAPVREVGWSQLSRARPLMEDVWPGVTDMLRSASALDNCFPSLHVSCTLTAFWFARRHGPQTLAWTTGIGALLTAWATMVLGIHWATDVVAGLLFGSFCSIFAQRVGGRLWPEQVRASAELVASLTTDSTEGDLARARLHPSALRRPSDRGDEVLRSRPAGAGDVEGGPVSRTDAQVGEPGDHR